MTKNVKTQFLTICNFVLKEEAGSLFMESGNKIEIFVFQAIHKITDNYNPLNKCINALLLATFCDLKASYNSHNGNLNTH
jgi:hypothetical protein